MKKLVRAAVAAAVLSAGAASPAFAALVLPSTGSSSGALTLFDSLNQRSLVVTMNVNFADLLPTLLNQPNGYSIANALSAPDQAEVASFIAGGGNITWSVGAADSLGVGGFGGRRVMSTGVGGLTTLSVTNGAVTQAANAAENFFARVNGVCGSDTSCFADAAPESAPEPDDFAAYAGNLWGHLFNGNLNPSLAAGVAVGVSQAFYLFSTAESATAPSGAQATRTAYANALGFGVWNLSGTGELSYSLAGAPQVPVPAAIWLLGSGLLGMAAVRRRRETDKTVAA